MNAPATVLTDSNLILYKEVDKAIIAVDDTLTYTLNFNNRGSQSTDYDLYDIFPYDEDNRKNNFSGSLRLINILSDYGNIEIKYTFDEGLTTGKVIALGGTFKTKEEWEAEGKNIENSTGIHIFIKSLPANQSNSITLTFETLGNNKLDALYNDFAMKYQLNGKDISIISNIVRSTVPGIEKEVALTEVDEYTTDLEVDPSSSFVYKLNLLIPEVGVNQSVNAVTIEDKLEPVLDFVSGKLVDEKGQDLTSYFGTLREVGGVVQFDFENNLKEVPGKPLSLIIIVKLKADYDLSSYIDEKVPNVATLTVDGKEDTSNEVKVYVPPIIPDPVISKGVKAINESNFVNNAEVLFGEEFIYGIDISIPIYPASNPLTNVTITDQLEPVLEYFEGKLVDDNGVNVSDIYGVISEQDGLVRYGFTKNLDIVQGSKFTLLIIAKVEKGTNLSAYISNTVPNKAEIETNNNVKLESNEVAVKLKEPPVVIPPKPIDPPKPTDPPEDDPLPKITKSVKTEESIGFVQDGSLYYGEEYVYKIDIDLKEYGEKNPINSVVIKDQLEESIEFVSGKLINRFGEDVTSDYGILNEKNGLVKYEFTKNYEVLKNEVLSLIITVKIPKGSDLSKYKDSKVPNKGILEVNNELTVRSRNVTVDVKEKQDNIGTNNPNSEIVPKPGKDTIYKPSIETTLPILPQTNFPEESVNENINVDITNGENDSTLKITEVSRKANPKTDVVNYNFMVNTFGLIFVLVMLVKNKNKFNLK